MAAKKKAVWIVEAREGKQRAWRPYEDFSSYFNVTRAQANDEKKTLMEMNKNMGTEFRVSRYERTWSEGDTK